MTRNESLAREVTLNDEEPGEEAEKLYDFRTAKPGEVVRILTEQGVHELVRLATAGDDDGSMEKWLHAGQAAELTLFEPNRQGASFRLPGRTVVKQGLELRVNYTDLPPDEANVSRSLGRVVSLAEALEAAEMADDETAFVAAS